MKFAMVYLDASLPKSPGSISIRPEAALEILPIVTTKMKACSPGLTSTMDFRISMYSCLRIRSSSSSSVSTTVTCQLSTMADSEKHSLLTASQSQPGLNFLGPRMVFPDKPSRMMILLFFGPLFLE